MSTRSEGVLEGWGGGERSLAFKPLPVEALVTQGHD